MALRHDRRHLAVPASCLQATSQSSAHQTVTHRQSRTSIQGSGGTRKRQPGVVAIALVVLFGLNASPLWAGTGVDPKYEAVVSKAMPGYTIVSPSHLYRPDGMSESEHTRYGTLVVGDIDGDGRRDMAAIVAQVEPGKTPAQLRAAGVAFCFGIDRREPECRLHAWGGLALPLNEHLIMVPADTEVHCFGRYIGAYAPIDGAMLRSPANEKDLGEASIRSKTIGIGEYRILGGGDVVVFHHSKNEFLKCITSD